MLNRTGWARRRDVDDTSCVPPPTVEIASKALITLAMIPDTCQVIGQSCGDLVTNELHTIWGLGSPSIVSRVSHICCNCSQAFPLT